MTILLMGHGGGKIKRKLLLAVLLLSGVTLSLNMGDVSAAAVNSSIETNQSNISNQSIETQSTVQTNKVNNNLIRITNNNSNDNVTNQSSVSQYSTYTEPTVYVNINLVSDAANRLKTYVETNNKLPNYVTISNYQVTISQFLGLLTDSLVQINSGSNNAVTIKTVGNPISSSESLKSGNIYKTEYIDLAQKINDIIETTGNAPGYMSTTLGKIGYESLVYDYSKILSFYNSNKRLPNYVSVKAFSTTNLSSTTNQTPSEGTNTTTNTSGTPPKNGYGPYNVVTTSKYVSATVKCSCGAGTYTYKTATFLNYCPQCHHYGTLGMTKYPLYEGHWTCSYCDCDYCAQCGKENIKGSKLWLTPA